MTPLSPTRTSPAAPAHAFQHVRVATGVRLRYAVRGNPAGPAVILLHGYSDSWFSFSGVLPLLPARWRVYALDQRGHGGSGRPDTGYALPELAADVLAFMDALGVERATVVGHSLGSFVAQQVALAAPARVERLVLVGSATTPGAFHGLHELAGAVASLPDPVPAEFAREFQESTVHRPLPPGFLDTAVEESRKLPARAWRAIMDGLLSAAPPEGLRGRGIPTLVLWGDRDAFVSRADQDALLELIGSAALRVYAETGHAPHWERPERFARDLEAFAAEAR